MTDLPKTLPAVPTGFTQKLQTHLNYGAKGSQAMYTIHAPDGTQLPITYQYKTNKSHTYEWRGYLISGSDVVLKTWAELAAAWPAEVERLQLIAGGK